MTVLLPCVLLVLRVVADRVFSSSYRWLSLQPDRGRSKELVGLALIASELQYSLQQEVLVIISF